MSKFSALENAAAAAAKIIGGTGETAGAAGRLEATVGRKLLEESGTLLPRRSVIETAGSIDFGARARLVDNPYLKEYEATQANQRYKDALAIARGRKPEGVFSYGEAHKIQADTRHNLTHRYSWAVPNDEALKTLAEQGPLIEAGAGTGYWSHLLRKMGADVVAFDQHGTDVAANYYHRTANKAWTDVIKGTEGTVAKHPDRTLFMSFPPMDEPFGQNVLNNYAGKRFVFVGECGPGSCTGDKAFHETLDTRWKELKSVDLPNWEVASGPLWDKLYLFERK